MTNNIYSSVHDNVKLANNTTLTFENVYSRSYVQDSIKSVVDKTIKQYPILLEYRDDLKQEILIHLNNELPKYNNKSSINVFCRICIETGLKKARRKYLQKRKQLIYYAIPIHEIENDIDNDIKISVNISEYEQFAKNNIEEYFVDQDFSAALRLYSPLTQQIGGLLQTGLSCRDISKIIGISKTTIYRKYIPAIKECFLKEFC